MPARKSTKLLLALVLVVSSSSSTIAQIKPPVEGQRLEARARADLLVKPECDEAAPSNGESGGVILPPGATDYEPPTTVNYEPVGTLNDLYPEANGAGGIYPLPCEPSIGGTLPAGATIGPTADELAAEAFLSPYEQAVLPPPPPVTGLPTFPMDQRHDCGMQISATQAPQILPCSSPQFMRAGEPFEGRDIIYVHGLATEHLKKWLLNDPAVKQKWPVDAAAFVGANGYFRTYANNYWADHIREHLFDINSPNNPNAGYQWPAGGSAEYKPKGNRVLLVAWSSNQTIEYAQHALISQIRSAIISGTNVISPPGYPKSWRNRFCATGCIIVSHSTGGLIVSSAFGKAMAGAYGPGGREVVGSVRAHVAFQGAMSGSRLATVAVAMGTAGAAPSTAVQNILCPIQNHLFDTCSINTGFVVNTILRDLLPPVAQNVWGPWVAKSPVRTLMIAGGHPVGNQSGTTSFILPGLDDGVVSMNSACANPAQVVTPVIPASGVSVSSFVKAFDMGSPGVRATRMLQAQLSYRGEAPRQRYLAGGCTPFLSTTGMVMPLDDTMSGTSFDVRQRYPNHFSFIQGAMDHSHNGGNVSTENWPSEPGQPASVPRRYLNFLTYENAEEMSAVTNNGIYYRFPDTTYLVHPSFSGQMREYKSGRSFKFRLLGKTRRVWIWKRTYHLLNNWENMASTHYVYEYVGRR